MGDKRSRHEKLKSLNDNIYIYGVSPDHFVSLCHGLTWHMERIAGSRREKQREKC